MSYQPNRLFTDPLSRTIVEAVRPFNDLTLLLRPSRRFLFYAQYQPREFVPEFNKPCFGALAFKNDPDKKPQIVIETEPISDSLRRSYLDNEILWIEVFEEPGGLAMVSEHCGVRMSVNGAAHKLSKMVAAPLSWVRERMAQPLGRLVQSYHERLLRDAVETLAHDHNVECHHQVPFGFATGYRKDMPKPIARAAMDVVITISYETDPDGIVLLPVKIDLHNCHQDDPITMDRDRMLAEYAGQIEMPMLIVRAGAEPEEYIFDCPSLGVSPGFVRGRDRADWGRALSPYVCEAMRYIGRPVALV